MTTSQTNRQRSLSEAQSNPNQSRIKPPPNRLLGALFGVLRTLRETLARTLPPQRHYNRVWVMWS
jgi:hypothetical protein